MDNVVEECCRELRCLEAAMERALGSDDDPATLAIEHYLRSVASVRERLEAGGRDRIRVGDRWFGSSGV